MLSVFITQYGTKLGFSDLKFPYSVELGGKISLKRRGGLEFLRIVSFFQFVFNVLAPVLFLNDKKNNLSFKCKKWGMSYFVEEHVFKELNTV